MAGPRRRISVGFPVRVHAAPIRRASDREACDELKRNLK